MALLEKLESGLFRIASDSRAGLYHVVDLKARSCTCEAFRFRGRCKHIPRVEAEAEKQNAHREENVESLCEVAGFNRGDSG